VTDAGDIKIYDMKKMDLTGAVIIEGFPSVGLVSSIVADYIITTLELEQIGVLDSEKFPTISLVRNGIPYNPVRIYGGTVGEGGTTKLVVFISEFQPPQGMIRSITTTVLDWMQEQNCTLLISPEGFVIGEGSEEGGEELPEEEGEEGGEPTGHEGHLPEGIPEGGLEDLSPEDLKAKLSKAIELMRQSVHTYGVGCTDNANALLKKYDVPLFEEGVISGVSGVLLNEGKRRRLEVVCLLAQAHPACFSRSTSTRCRSTPRPSRSRSTSRWPKRCPRSSRARPRRSTATGDRHGRADQSGQGEGGLFPWG